MKIRTIVLLGIVISLGLPALAQTGQNLPVYDPWDAAARPLPPNIYLVLDVSGSMSWRPSDDDDASPDFRDPFGEPQGSEYQQQLTFDGTGWSTARNWSVGDTIWKSSDHTYQGVLVTKRPNGIANTWLLRLVDSAKKFVTSDVIRKGTGTNVTIQSLTDVGDIAHSVRMYFVKHATNTIMNYNWVNVRWSLVSYNSEDYRGTINGTTIDGTNYTEARTVAYYEKRQNIYFSSGNWTTANGWSVASIVQKSGDPTITGMLISKNTSSRYWTLRLLDPTKQFTSSDSVVLSSGGSALTLSSVSATSTDTDSPYAYPGSACSNTYSQVLQLVPHDATVTDELFKTGSDDAKLNNKPNIQEWVDLQFPNSSTLGDTTGLVTVPGWDKYFLKEILGHGSTPIGYTLHMLDRYIHGEEGTATRYNYSSGSSESLTKVSSWDTFVQQHIIDSTHPGSCRCQAVVVVTDGNDTCDLQSSIDYAAHLYSQHGVKVFVIGFANMSDNINNIASAGGSGTAYSAEDDGQIEEAMKAIFYSIDSPESGGDTEPVLGFLPKSDGDVSWSNSENSGNLPNDNFWDQQQDSAGTMITYGVQNVMVKASSSYTPVFQGHLRLFQAIIKDTSTTDSKKIVFLNDFSSYTTGSGTKAWHNMIWDAGSILAQRIKDNVSPRTLYTFTDDTNGEKTPSSFNVTTIKSLLPTIDDAQASAFYNYVANQSLGDITSSTPAFVGPPDYRLHASESTFREWALNSARAERTPVVLVGANDGMLHCFNAKNGAELWSIIPYEFLKNGVAGKLYAGLFAAGDTTQQNQPANLWANRGVGLLVPENRRPHKYFVASSPRVTDIKVVSGGTTTWKTICVFGLGGGGKQYECLDITDPTNPKRLWVFDGTGSGTASVGLGETWCTPAFGRLKNGESFGVFGSGLNVDDTSDAGKHVYLLNLLNGSVIKYWSVGGNNSDLGHPTVGGTTYSGLVNSIGNCVQAPPTVFDSLYDYDEAADRIYVTDYTGEVFEIKLDTATPQNESIDDTTKGLKSLTTDSFVKIYTTANQKPIYSGVSVNQVRKNSSSDLKTLILFAEYGDAVDKTIFSSGVQKTGTIYGLVEENLGGSGSLINLASATFHPETDKGFYYTLGNFGTGVIGVETGLQRPDFFWGKDTSGNYSFFIGATTWEMKFSLITGTCDDSARTNRAVPMGASRSYIFKADTSSGGFGFKSGSSYLTVSDLGQFGRVTSFHKGMRGEGWIDTGTGNIWGFNFNPATGSFGKMGGSGTGGSSGDGMGGSGGGTGGGLNAVRKYWRELK